MLNGIINYIYVIVSIFLNYYDECTFMKDSISLSTTLQFIIQKSKNASSHKINFKTNTEIVLRILRFENIKKKLRSFMVTIKLPSPAYCLHSCVLKPKSNDQKTGQVVPNNLQTVFVVRRTLPGLFFYHSIAMAKQWRYIRCMIICINIRLECRVTTLFLTILLNSTIYYCFKLEKKYHSVYKSIYNNLHTSVIFSIIY
ncbi:hypothetical protein AGLY_003995 [Aphis glycines]|uniref:Uncharacterized protein n=1 Tax=Aphis glycines TaxID=307491 RepID=A0A6G0TY59_APHGL|nr:hypothetical protein AGLY_003995 [Aphis glycines]